MVYSPNTARVLPIPWVSTFPWEVWNSLGHSELWVPPLILWGCPWISPLSQVAVTARDGHASRGDNADLSFPNKPQLLAGTVDTSG